MGNHFIKSTSLSKTQSPVSDFCRARIRVCDAVFENSPFGDDRQFLGRQERILSQSFDICEIITQGV